MDDTKAEIESLYRDVGSQLWTYIRRRTNRQDIAEELFQEAFLVATRRIDAVRGAASSRAWLFGVARNLLREQFRSSPGTQPLQDEPEARRSEDNDARIEVMREAVAKLPDTQREVLELRLTENLSYQEIAEALDIPIGTVRSRIHHAILQLKSRLQDHSSGQTGSAASTPPNPRTL